MSDNKYNDNINMQNNYSYSDNSTDTNKYSDSNEKSNNSMKVKRYSLDINDASKIYNKDSSSCSSLGDDDKIINIQKFDKIPSDLYDEEFNNYIINYDIYKPPEQFEYLLDYYINNHIGEYDKNKQYYIFPADRLIILLSLFFGDNKIANKISLDITVRDNVLDDIGCCFKQIAQEDDKIIIKNIFIGDVTLKYLNNGILYNRLENLYQICLNEVYAINSDKLTNME